MKSPVVFPSPGDAGLHCMAFSEKGEVVKGEKGIMNLYFLELFFLLFVEFVDVT